MPHDPRKHCCWCGQDITPENRVVLEIERLEPDGPKKRTYYFNHPSCKRAFLKDANDTSGD